MKQQILQILEDYFADEKMVEEIIGVLDKGVGNAVSMLDVGLVKQSDIRDWATLHGYAMVKCASIADRLKVEKVAREIWGSHGKGDKYFLD
jgi:hypothetical protein